MNKLPLSNRIGSPLGPEEHPPAQAHLRENVKKRFFDQLAEAPSAGIYLADGRYHLLDLLFPNGTQTYTTQSVRMPYEVLDKDTVNRIYVARGLGRMRTGGLLELAQFFGKPLVIYEKTDPAYSFYGIYKPTSRVITPDGTDTGDDLLVPRARSSESHHVQE